MESMKSRIKFHWIIQSMHKTRAKRMGNNSHLISNIFLNWMIEKSFNAIAVYEYFICAIKNSRYFAFFVGSMFIFLSFECSRYTVSSRRNANKTTKNEHDFHCDASILGRYSKIHWLLFTFVHVSPTGDILLIFHKQAMDIDCRSSQTAEKQPKTA